VVTDSLPEALALQARVTNLTTVSTVDSMATFLTEDQDRKLSLIGGIKETLGPIRFGEPDTAPVALKDFSRTLWSLQGYLGLAATEVERENARPELLQDLRSLRTSLGVLRQRMLSGNAETQAAKLAAFQQALFRDIKTTFEALQNQDNRDRMRVEDLPPALRNRFVSFDGTLHAIQVYPRRDVWQRANQEAFVAQLRKELDPDGDGRPIITGTPVQLLEYTSLLKESYEEAAYYATGAIALLVFIHFRSLTCVLLALLPVAAGTLWMIGFMDWKNIDFNPANIMTLPLVIGIGVTSGIHILNRYAEEATPSILAKSTGKAVLVSALTTIAGFGSLVLGKHQGIASLGYVMAVGTGTCMAAALTILPAVLALLGRRGWTLKKKPSGETGKLDTGLGGTEVKTSTAA
jgi:hypothetical protein